MKIAIIIGNPSWKITFVSIPIALKADLQRVWVVAGIKMFVFNYLIGLSAE